MVKPAPATEDDVLLVHTRLHLATVKQAGEGGGSWLDPDTHVSPRSYEIALLSAGGAIEATRLWNRGLVPFALIRPPGHHATPDRAMGFCLFDNIAIAAARLLAEGYERVAIIDWDVHHGNGTQAAFYDEPRVLFVSLHQWPHYPGSGFFNECGEGDAAGLHRQSPAAGGLHGRRLRARPSRRSSSPSSGSSRRRPSSSRPGRTSTATTRWAACTSPRRASRTWRCAACALPRELCEDRLAFVLEGGYDRDATARAVEAILRAVSDETAPAIAAEGTERAAAAIARARETQAAYWDL